MLYVYIHTFIAFKWLYLYVFNLYNEKNVLHIKPPYCLYFILRYFYHGKIVSKSDCRIIIFIKFYLYKTINITNFDKLSINKPDRFRNQFTTQCPNLLRLNSTRLFKSMLIFICINKDNKIHQK